MRKSVENCEDFWRDRGQEHCWAAVWIQHVLSMKWRCACVKQLTWIGVQRWHDGLVHIASKENSWTFCKEIKMRVQQSSVQIYATVRQKIFEGRSVGIAHLCCSVGNFFENSGRGGV